MGGLDVLLQSLIGPEPAVRFLLLVSLGLALLAYRKEKLKNDRVAADRLRETREDTELLVETVNEAVHTVREFAASNDALKHAFEVLASTVKEGRRGLNRDRGE